MSLEAAASPIEKVLTPPRTNVAHAWLQADAFEMLQREANRRRQHPDALCAAIIDAVLRGGAIEAVLDC